MKITGFLLFSLVIFIFCFPIQAQQKTSTQLIGRIFDLQGAVIPGIKVTAYSQTKVKYERLTNEDGVYILDLPEGIYNLEINLQNVNYNLYETVKLKNYRIVPAYDGKINLDVPLSVIGDGILCELIVSDSPKQSQRAKRKRIKSIKRKNNK